MSKHKTLFKTHAKTELHILDQMELDELISFADRHGIDIVEEQKISQEAILQKILNDPWVEKVRKFHHLC